ncbi:MAG: hypothetical protein BWK73_10295 [Thiothrix lacustris]|uniref:Phosphoribosyl-AMP cyclohydrolase n=1 Tax=Thiothrix lacustris TaxID=525917 RepID=A0A1Y1QUI6_9GAMM|nr:MAG: hypothetical protein BWK73_10295 [Thiothrix lacustris]
MSVVAGNIALAEFNTPLTAPTAPVAPTAPTAPVVTPAYTPAVAPITERDVQAAQQAWADGIVTIGKIYQDKGDYSAAARKLLDQLYAFDEGEVLFKPTKAAEDQFRGSKDEALSYFVTGIEAEDHGFALQPWSNVRFENEAIALNQDTAEAMGDYYFTDAATGKETKVEYTFGYKRAKTDGHLMIFLHHSSLPYHPEH